MNKEGTFLKKLWCCVGGKQKQGNLGTYANRFLGFIEYQFLSQYNGPKPWTLRSLHQRLYRRQFLCQRWTDSINNRYLFLSPGSEIYLGNFWHLFGFSRHQNFNWRQRFIHKDLLYTYRLTWLLVVFIFASITRQVKNSIPFSEFLRLRH